MIIGIGELLWDLYPDGRRVAGGAPFNFVHHCHQLGHEAIIVSRLGDDDLGRELRDSVRRLGLSDEFIQTDPVYPTGTVRVTVDAAGQPSYEIVEQVAWDYLEPVSTPEAKVVCYGTLGQRAPTSRGTIQSVVSRAAMRVFDVNLRQHFYSRAVLDESFAAATHVKMSEEEWPVVAALFAWDRPNALVSEYDGAIQWMAFTRGRDGVSCHAADPGFDCTWPGEAVDVADTVGAGDAFTAAMACCHLEGRPLRDCARFANRYAARVCEHRGGTPVIDRRTLE